MRKETKARRDEILKERERKNENIQKQITETQEKSTKGRGKSSLALTNMQESIASSALNNPSPLARRPEKKLEKTTQKG